jgi:hypothetical protein
MKTKADLSHRTDKDILKKPMKATLQQIKDKIYEEIVNSANNKNATFRGGEYRIGLRKAIDIIEQFIEDESND